MEVPSSPLIDRGEPELVEESKEPQGQATMVTVVKPRTGGEIDGVTQTGDSDLDGEKLSEPEDILCFHSTSFKEMQKQLESLKSGLPETHKLQLLGGNKTSIELTMWVTWMIVMLVQKGMNTVFHVLHDNHKTDQCFKELG